MDGKQEQRKGIRGRHPDAWSRAFTVVHVALALWFAYWAWQMVGGTFSDWPNHLDVLGIDGRLYYRASAMWLAGGDPWTAYTATNTWPVTGQYIHFLFTGPPPTVLAFAPFAWIPETPFVVGWFALTVAAAVYTLRRLRLPLWWLLFPPLAQGIMVANPQVVCLALLLCGSDRLRWLAAPMKAYAVIPQVVALRQWRALGVLAAAGLISVVVFWPLWHQYLSSFQATNTWLLGVTHGGDSAAIQPDLWVLGLVAIAALAVLSRREAGWLAVPILWPATQYFYATFLLPLRSPWLAAAVAVSEGGIFMGWFGLAATAQVMVAYALARALWIGGARLSRLADQRQVFGRAAGQLAADRPALSVQP